MAVVFLTPEWRRAVFDIGERLEVLKCSMSRFWRSASAFLPPAVSTFTPATGCEVAMFDLILGGAISVAIFVYLVFALLRPERF